MDAVIADVRACRITGDGNGLVTATRHVSLLCHLAVRLANDAEYALASKPSTKASPPAAAMAQAAGHLGQAIADYTQALTPLVALTTRGTQNMIHEQIDGLAQDSWLRVHLRYEAEALTAARNCLHAIDCPIATTTSLPPHTPSTGTHPRTRG